MTNGKKQKGARNLDSLLNQYDEQLNRVEKEEKKEKSDRETFTEQFLTLCDQTIKPVFERLKSKVEKRGHKVQIETREPSWDSRKKVPIEPSISFDVELKRKSDNDRYYGTRDKPHISFICNASKRIVSSYESTIGLGHGGHGGGRGEFNIEAVTADLVEKNFMDWFDSLISGR